MLVKFTPPSLVNGYVMIDVPSYPQRLKYAKDLDINGEGVSGYDVMIKMLELANVHVKEVHIEGYEKFSDMLEDSELDSVNNEIAQVILNGVKLPKK